MEVGADYQSKIETLWASYESKKAEEAALLAKSNKILQNLVSGPASEPPACSCLPAELLGAGGGCAWVPLASVSDAHSSAGLHCRSLPCTCCPSACPPRLPHPPANPHLRCPPTPTDAG